MSSTNAAGYAGLRGTALIPPLITNLIIQDYGICTALPGLAQATDIGDKDIFHHAELIYQRYDYGGISPMETHNNEGPVLINFEGLKSESVKVCNFAETELKMSDRDYQALQFNGNFTQVEKIIREEIRRDMIVRTERDAFARIVASAAIENTGSNAGAQSGNVDLGSITAPIQLNKRSLSSSEDFLFDLQQVMSEQEGLGCSSTHMTLVINPQIQSVFTRIFKEFNMCCSDGKNVLLNGLFPKSLMGFDVVVTNRLPKVIINGKTIYQPFLVDRRYVAHKMNIYQNKWAQVKRDHYFMFDYAWLTHVLQPLGVIVGQVEIV